MSGSEVEINLRGRNGVQCVRLGRGVADLNSDPPAKREETKRSGGWQEARWAAGSAELRLGLRRALRCSKTERLGPAFHTCVDECACGCVRVCARACARAEGEPGEPRGGRCAPERLTRRFGWVLSAPRSAEAGSGSDDPAPAGRAVAYTGLGLSTLQSPPLLPAKRASLKLGPADPPFLAPGGQGRQRSATSLTHCGSTPPPGHVGCELPRDSHPSLASPGFHQACTFSLRVSRYLRS